MIKFITRLLGSIQLAIILIITTLVFVIAGTFLESATESHLFASALTYNNPLFTFLLWMYFINILFASLKRWPFKIHHIPFLITHLGLLMILAGVLSKSYWGLQGTMQIIAGTASSEVIIPHTHAIRIEKRNPANPREIYFKYLQIKENLFGRYYSILKNEELEFELLEFIPNVSSKYASWIKDDQLLISGFPPVPVFENLTLSTLPELSVVAIRTNNIAEAAKIAYLHGLQVTFLNTETITPLLSIPLSEALGQDIIFPDGSATLTLDFEGPDISDFLNSKLTASLETDKNATISIALNGPESLLNKNLIHPELGIFPISIELKRQPTIVFIQDDEGDIFLFTFDPYGRINVEVFPSHHISPLIVYDKGYGGYAVQAKIPHFEAAKVTKEKEILDSLTVQLKEVIQQESEIIPPLQLLRTASEKSGQDFAKVCVEFLTDWAKSYCWAYPQDRLLPPSTALAFAHFDSEIEVNQQAHLFSIWLRAYGIHLHHLITSEMLADLYYKPNPSKIIETSLALEHTEVPTKKKREDNIPKIGLRIKRGKLAEEIELAYSPSTKGLKWPVLNGEYTLRFQPYAKSIPYHIRLRDARQINYPHSSQPFSYESDLLITDLRTNATVEKTISMNNVHQTWDGYRFYLANIFPSDESSVQHVQIAVNHDPTKYFLTYPGGFILSLGVVLLFWFSKNKL